jgi:hypothetical protein
VRDTALAGVVRATTFVAAHAEQADYFGILPKNGPAIHTIHMFGLPGGSSGGAPASFAVLVVTVLCAAGAAAALVRMLFYVMEMIG